MDRKYKLLLLSSLVAIMATGCSSFGQNGNTDPQTSVTGSTDNNYGGQQASSGAVVTETNTCGQCALNQNTIDHTATNTTTTNSQQAYVDQWNQQQNNSQNTTTTTTNGRTQQWYIDQYNRNQAAAKAKAQTKVVTTNGRSQQWYIDQYNRNQAAKTVAAVKPVQTQTVNNGRSKQWYVDQWNRQQAAAKAKTAYVAPKPVVTQPAYVAPAYVAPKPVAPVKPYVPPTPAPVTKTTTQYVDYTQSTGSTATVVAPSNKSLYTGSFQQPRTAYTQYTPKTYTGGANAGTSTSYTSTTTTTPAAGGSFYTVKKGDTVFEVMRQTGVYWKEVINLNNLQGPSYTIQPGQKLRLK